jgi:hypothetical protein
MKTLLTIWICSVALATGAFAQGPTAPPATTPGTGLSPAAAASAGPSISPAGSPSDLADKLHRRLDKKFKQKGIHFTIGDKDKDKNKDAATDDSDDISLSHNDIPAMVIPLVGIVFLTIFGAPVLIVAVILYFGFSKNRMMHKTVRMMVEKGQPVPAVLLNPPPHVRKRSDMRRGVVLMMVGLGLMLFLGAENDFEGGSWAIGVIPFLIGAGYLLVWKLDKGDTLQASGDNPPPVP